jgi:Flp pilus assembly pilin Flp
MRTFFRRLLSDESGSDVVEYALLAAFVGVESIAGIAEIQASLHTAYVRWDTAGQNLSNMPAPRAGGF